MTYHLFVIHVLYTARQKCAHIVTYHLFAIHVLIARQKGAHFVTYQTSSMQCQSTKKAIETYLQYNDPVKSYGPVAQLQ